MGKTESNTPHTQYQTPIQPVYREIVRVFTITHTGKIFLRFLEPTKICYIPHFLLRAVRTSSQSEYTTSLCSDPFL